MRLFMQHEVLVINTEKQYQGSNKVYGIRDQRYKMGRDQGSQPRDLESQRVDQDQQRFSWNQGSGQQQKHHIALLVLYSDLTALLRYFEIARFISNTIVWYLIH